MATVNTTWTSPASATLDKSTGATIDETMTDAWSSNLYHLGGTAGYIGCQAVSTSATSVANTTDTPVPLQGEQFDSDPNGAMHDNAVSNTRVVARTAGVYHIYAHASFASNASGYRQISVLVNGVTQMIHMSNPISGTDTWITTSTVKLLNASDYVEVAAYQSSGGALDVSAALSVVKA